MLPNDQSPYLVYRPDILIITWPDWRRNSHTDTHVKSSVRTPVYISDWPSTGWEKLWSFRSAPMNLVCLCPGCATGRMPCVVTQHGGASPLLAEECCYPQSPHLRQEGIRVKHYTHNSRTCTAAVRLSRDRQWFSTSADRTSVSEVQTAQWVRVTSQRNPSESTAQFPQTLTWLLWKQCVL